MRRPTLQDRLEYLGVIVFVKAACLCPARAAVWFGALLGRVCFDIVRFRRAVTVSNIRSHLGDDTEQGSAASVGRHSYAGFGMGLAEYARLPKLTMDFVNSHIQLDGLRHLDAALAEGRGAILVTGHFGSWELMGGVLALLGYPVDFVVGVQRNPLVQKLMNHLRRRLGIGIIEPASLLRITHSLRANRFVAMLPDQDAGRHGIFAEFLGEIASTPQGPGRLAMMTRAPVIPGFIVRQGGTKHRIRIEEPIYARGEPGKTAVLEVTQGYTRLIEAYVRAYPDQYLWAHRRWKTRQEDCVF